MNQPNMEQDRVWWYEPITIQSSQAFTRIVDEKLDMIHEHIFPDGFALEHDIGLFLA